MVLNTKTPKQMAGQYGELQPKIKCYMVIKDCIAMHTTIV